MRNVSDRSDNLTKPVWPPATAQAIQKTELDGLRERLNSLMNSISTAEHAGIPITPLDQNCLRTAQKEFDEFVSRNFAQLHVPGRADDDSIKMHSPSQSLEAKQLVALQRWSGASIHDIPHLHAELWEAYVTPALRQSVPPEYRDETALPPVYGGDGDDEMNFTQEGFHILAVDASGQALVRTNVSSGVDHSETNRISVISAMAAFARFNEVKNLFASAPNPFPRPDDAFPDDDRQKVEGWTGQNVRDLPISYLLDAPELDDLAPMRETVPVEFRGRVTQPRVFRTPGSPIDYTQSSFAVLAVDAAGQALVRDAFTDNYIDADGDRVYVLPASKAFALVTEHRRTAIESYAPTNSDGAKEPKVANQVASAPRPRGP